MASQATRQRKGVGAPKSAEIPTGTPTALKVAKVKRNKFGTKPWDRTWLNLDCCGLFCAAITYMLHLYGVYAVCLVLIPPWMSSVNTEGIRTISCFGHLNRVAFTLVAILAVYAHFKAMTTNPGAVPPDAIPVEEFNKLINPIKDNNERENLNATNNNSSNITNGCEQQGSSLMVEDPLPTLKPFPPIRKGRRLCRRCNAFKPKRAHHCSICKRCIIKMDHHCPWVNNCVGIGNHKYFLLFIFYTCLSCMYSLSLIAIRFFDCMGRHGHIRTHHITCLDRPSQLLNILGLFVEAILFGLFTICMMVDQAGVVMTKMTHIDRLKGGGEASGSSALAGVIEVFGLNPKKVDLGGRFRPDWLSPFHSTCFPSSLRDEIMGFCKPCGSSKIDQEETELSPIIRHGSDVV